MWEYNAWEQSMVTHMYEDVTKLLFIVNDNLKNFIKQEFYKFSMNYYKNAQINQ